MGLNKDMGGKCRGTHVELTSLVQKHNSRPSPTARANFPLTTYRGIDVDFCARALCNGLTEGQGKLNLLSSSCTNLEKRADFVGDGGVVGDGGGGAGDVRGDGGEDVFKSTSTNEVSHVLL